MVGASTQLELNRENVVGYLRDRGVLDGSEPAETEELGGGVSNVVLRVTQGTERIVLKQPLARLRVAQEWQFDRKRVFVERDCLGSVAELVGADAVPALRFCDSENFILAMSSAPSSARSWKEMLLAGEVSAETAAELGSLLGAIQTRASASSELEGRFDDPTILRQGRTDPYHRTIAARHPDLAEAIEADIDRLETTRETLALGDFSPKNVLVGDGLRLIDLETAHWGDPAFDPAFCLTHLMLKTIHVPARSDALLAAAEAFLAAFMDARPAAAELPAAIATEVSCLLLARVDGKSPAEYLTEDERNTVRALARELIASQPQAPELIFQRVAAV